MVLRQFTGVLKMWNESRILNKRQFCFFSSQRNCFRKISKICLKDEKCLQVVLSILGPNEKIEKVPVHQNRNGMKRAKYFL